MVPSALTYRVRQLEQALDVTLFERGARQAKLTEAGAELLRESHRLLADVDAIAARVKQVATGWEPQFTIAVDSLIDRRTVIELCARFYQEKTPTRLRLRAETLSGTLESVLRNDADLALGVISDTLAKASVNWKSLGTTAFVFAVSPAHPLAKAPEPLTDAMIRPFRAVAIADSAQQGAGMTRNLLAGQEVLTVTDLGKKIDAQAAGLGVGFVPLCRARETIAAGRLVLKQVARPGQQIQVGYAWNKEQRPAAGRALRWWLEQLQAPATRGALLGGPRKPG